MVVAAGLFALLLFGAGLYMIAHRVGPAAKLIEHPPATTDPETTAIGSQPIYQSQCEFSANAPLGADCMFLARSPGGGAAADSFQSQAVEIDVPSAWLAQQPHGTVPNDPGVVAALVQTTYYPVGSGAISAMTLSVDPTYATHLQAAGVTPLQLLAWMYHDVPRTQWPPWLPGGS